MLDVSALRAETPTSERLIHFNNAGASLMPEPVYRAVTDHLAREQGVGGYEAQRDAADLRDNFYRAFADMLGCATDEIAFAESATKAWDAVFYALPLKAGDRVIVHRSAYTSNYLALLHHARRRGLEVDFAPSDEQGQIDVEALPGLIRSKTRLILLTHCPSQSGLIQPAEAVGRVAKAHGLLYLLDACQSAGQMPLNVNAIGCDALTGTGRKFLRGPRGTGFLYIGKSLAETLDPVFIDLDSAVLKDEGRYALAAGAKRFESWERNVAGQIGLGAAVRYALDVGLDAISERVQGLAAELRAQLSSVTGVGVFDPGLTKSAIVTFAKDGIDVSEAQTTLREKGINVSTVPRTWAPLDASERDLPDLIRASIHAYNNEAEVDRFVEAIDAL